MGLADGTGCDILRVRSASSAEVPDGARTMSPRFLPSCFLVLFLVLAPGGTALAQRGAAMNEQVVRPTGPAAKKADELIRGYTARIEKEIEQEKKELERLRAEQHDLIDLRFAMAEAIAEIRGDLASKGTYSGDPVVYGQVGPQEKNTAAAAAAPRQGIAYSRDLFYGLGSALCRKTPRPSSASSFASSHRGPISSAWSSCFEKRSKKLERKSIGLLTNSSSFEQASRPRSGDPVEWVEAWGGGKSPGSVR